VNEARYGVRIAPRATGAVLARSLFASLCVPCLMVIGCSEQPSDGAGRARSGGDSPAAVSGADSAVPSPGASRESISARTGNAMDASPPASGTEPTPRGGARIGLAASLQEQRSADGTYLARWTPADGVLPDAEPFAMHFSVRRADGKPIAKSAKFLVDAEMPHHGHGMNVVPTVRLASASGQHAEAGPAESLLVADGMLLHMPGRWVLALDVEEDGVLERTQWLVDVE